VLARFFVDTKFFHYTFIERYLLTIKGEAMHYYIGEHYASNESHTPTNLDAVKEHIKKAYRGEEALASLLYRNQAGAFTPITLIPHNHHEINLLAGNQHLERISIA
jgi:hypothetical protein